MRGGRWPAELVLAVCLPEVYVSRTPMSEPLVQVLLFGGLCLFIDSLRACAGGDVGARRPGRGLALAGLGGLALGLTVLASIGSLGMLLPAFPVLAVLFVARRPQAGPFGLGLFLGIGIGLAAALVLARPYLSTLSAQLHLIGLCAAGFGVVTALLAPLAFPGVRSRVRRVCAFRLRFTWFKGEKVVLPSLGAVLAGLALVLPVLVLAGLAVRPYLQTVRGQTDPAMIRQVAALQRLERLPVDGHAPVLRVKPLLGVLVPRGARGAARLRGGGGARAAARYARCCSSSAPVRCLVRRSRLWGLPFLIIGWSVVTVLWDPAVVPWQPLASHRLVPVVLPGLLLLAVWVSSWLTSRASWSAPPARPSGWSGPAACSRWRSRRW